jgi:cytochrome b561
MVIIIFIIGLNLEKHEFNAQNMNIYRTHAILGVSLMFLTLLRLYIRRKHINELPPHITYYNKYHKKLVRFVQSLLYIFLIFTPMVGFITVYLTGALSYDLGGPFPTNADFDPDLLTIHKISVFILVTLIVLHIGGVFLYRIKTGENLISRMSLK